MDYVQPKLSHDAYGIFSTLKSYFLLTKPGILFGNSVTAAGGFALASHSVFNGSLFCWTLLGLSCVIASACVCNNYIDREADGKMVRTRQRALVRGDISERHALIFAGILGLLGIFILSYWTSLLAVAASFLGFVIYVGLYSYLKYRSMHATLVGSIAGAMPPLVGYAAVNHSLDAGAWVLFLLVALWQMPHFLAIGIYRLTDYTAAAIPIFPREKGILQTKVHMLMYIIAFLMLAPCLTLLRSTGILFLIVMLSLGFGWLLLALSGFRPLCVPSLWARRMFLFSLVVIMGLSGSLFF